MNNNKLKNYWWSTLTHWEPASKIDMLVARGGLIHNRTRNCIIIYPSRYKKPDHTFTIRYLWSSAYSFTQIPLRISCTMKRVRVLYEKIFSLSPRLYRGKTCYKTPGSIRSVHNRFGTVFIGKKYKSLRLHRG